MPSIRHFKPASGIPARKFAEDMLWLDTQGSKLHRGNSSAAFIYHLAAEGKGEAEILESMLGEFEGDEGLIKKETLEFLDLLVAQGLLEVIEG